MEAREKKAKGIAERLVSATLYSVSGLRSSWREEQAFRLEVIAVAALTPVALLLPVELWLRLLLIVSMLGVLIVELLNSAIEAVTDLTTSELHRLAKKAKDCASAAVFVSLISSGILWGVALFLWVRSA